MLMFIGVSLLEKKNSYYRNHQKETSNNVFIEMVNMFWLTYRYHKETPIEMLTGFK